MILSVHRQQILRLLFIGTAATLASPAHADAVSVAGREQFRRAYQAFIDNDAARGESLSAGLENYLLYPHLRYESLRHRVGKTGIDANRDEVRRFLREHTGTFAGEQLRALWLTLLARQQRWREFLADYVPQEKVALRCAHMSARIAVTADADTSPLETEARALWLNADSLPPECDGVGVWLAEQDLLTRELRWERMRLAMAKGNTTLATQIAARMSEVDQRRAQLWQNLYRNPAKFLDSPELDEDSTENRTLLRTGLERLARQNAGKADAVWQQRKDRYAYAGVEQGEIAAAIAIAAVRQDRADALQILDNVPAAYSSADLQRAQLQIALEHRNWERIERWTGQPPAPDSETLSWRYWRARAMAERGDATTARQIFLELSAERDYYGLLAAERLKVPYTFAHHPLAVTPAAVQQFLDHPGIQRARELRLLGFEPAARQEWSHEIGNLDRAGLMRAAAAAHALGWHERAIAALGKAKEYDDLELRYPVAFKDVVDEYAQLRGLEPAVMLSLIRSESAFNETARSPAGALGLMQVMPATGKLTAKKLGVPAHRTGDLLTAQSNVMIGSAYLRDMLDRFDGNLVMAAAAYNAGPHRVKVWRPQRDCIDADIWVDTIPFTETRRYVRNILFVTALYEMRLQQQVKPLRERLAAVHAENNPAASCKTG